MYVCAIQLITRTDLKKLTLLENKSAEIPAPREITTKPRVSDQVFRVIVTIGGMTSLVILGLIALFILCYDSREINLAQVYIRGQCMVDGLYLQRVANGLEKLNVSDLMIRVLGEMLNEIEHLRMSSAGFFDFLQKHQSDLENPNFRDHDKIFDNFMEMKSSNIMLSMNKDAFDKEITGPKVTRPSTVLAAERKNSIEPGHKVVVDQKKDKGFFF